MNFLVIIDMQKDFHPNEDTINYIREFLTNNSEKYVLIFTMDEHPQVIKKDTFVSGELVNYLWDLYYIYEDVDTITLMGVCTDICVLNNALILRSILPKTRIIVDAAGCNGTSPEMHKCALALMKANAIEVINDEEQ